MTILRMPSRDDALLPFRRREMAGWWFAVAVTLFNVAILLAVSIPLIQESRKTAEMLQESQQREEAVRQDAIGKATALVIRVNQLKERIDDLGRRLEQREAGE